MTALSGNILINWKLRQLAININIMVRQFVGEIAHDLIQNYNDWDLNYDHWAVKHIKDEQKGWYKLEINFFWWGTFMSVQTPAPIKLTREEKKLLWESIKTARLAKVAGVKLTTKNDQE